ncbi:hypothetical protein XENTR_v10010542 [Xenopus tropicalis]|uniref:Natural cytotoxicity triggering receptor 3 ligand 1 n=1 Tax=Xenopus tropicalis TaxID=8364 RepID=A0A8J0R8F7_XENTR|nr:natural cytotoxicity triggering receptor 3 ligand 1 [Xenopus tropicalis]KAE8605971.1 hypothetical protein XENTR_v10010542 [Xenopus tropicalis]
MDLGIGLNPPVLFCFLLVSVSLPGTDPVEVKVSDSPVKVLRDQDVFIPCTITGYSSAELDLQRLSVHWTLGSGPVYMYDRGSHNPIRPGSELSDRELKIGNAGLYIPQAQIRDGGEYSCTVTSGADKAEGRSTVEVSVKPSASLVPLNVLIEEGTEGAVMCRASNYYPKTIRFLWIKHLSDTAHVVLHQVSTNEPLENGDGTFTVTSQLLLNPFIEDDGGKYSCVISHRSLGNVLVLHFILYVNVSKTSLMVIGALIGLNAALILLICPCDCMRRKLYYKRDQRKKMCWVCTVT